MAWFITVILRVFIMSAVVFFTLFTVAVTMLIVPILLVVRSFRKAPSGYTINKHPTPHLIEGQYKVVD